MASIRKDKVLFSGSQAQGGNKPSFMWKMTVQPARVKLLSGCQHDASSHTDKFMLQQYSGRRSFIHRQPEARVQKMSQHVRRSVGQSVIWWVFCGNLEDGSNALILVPWRMSCYHLHHRATKTPADNSQFTQPASAHRYHSTI